MPRQELLSPAQCARLLALPTDPRQIAERYTFTPADLDLIAKCRGGPNRLGFAVQLGLLRYPGRAWTPPESVPLPLLQFIAAQVGVSPGRLTEYGTRDETRREHLAQAPHHIWLADLWCPRTSRSFYVAYEAGPQHRSGTCARPGTDG
jgi:hypothetical protein